MKKKIVGICVCMLLITVSPVAGIVNNKVENENFGEDELPLNVTLKVNKIFFRNYLIRVGVENLGDEHLTLGVRRPAGGFVIYDDDGKEVYSAPKYTIMIITSFSLKPYQRKILFCGIWRWGWVNMGWRQAEKCTIYGIMFGYEYNGELHPPIKSSPITIYPPSI